MAFSRIGLWAFDLIQVKQLQVSLEEHPERNTLWVEPTLDRLFRSDQS